MTSQDVLSYTLAAAIAVLTVFLVWVLFYVVSILRASHRAIRDVTAGIEKVHGILDSIQRTLSASTSHLSLIVTTVQQLVAMFARRRARGADDGDDGEHDSDR